jgi:hypothetical protein
MRLVLIVMLLAPVHRVDAQIVADTLFSWRAYAREGTTHLSIYKNPSDTDRPHTAVVREIGSNAGPASTADARHLVELVSRYFDLEPTEVTWIFHWGSFSFENARNSNRELFLRATFRRMPSGNLSTPNWRVLTRQEVEALTARRYKPPTT